MKTDILVMKTNDWSFKNEDGKVFEGTSLIFLTEDYERETSTVKDENLLLIQKTPLPAIFEADVKIVQKNFNGKTQIKYEVKTLKFKNSVKVF